jgi:hypothetical protein
MPILPNIQEKVQSEILPLVKPKWQSSFELGINALSLIPFSSINSNARMVGGTNGMMQMYRLIRKNLSSVFTIIMAKLFNITNESFINIDFTMFDPFAVLCFALQTQIGRAVPVWIETLKYPIEKDSQNIFILDSLKRFIKIVGCNFKIVADRGFIGEYLINGFQDLNLTFYVRMKTGKSVVRELKKEDKVVSLRKVKWLDFKAIVYGHKLRVIRSSKTLQQKLKLPECWYIITNDFEASRETILNTYYHRFEIEEAFKDLKHIFGMNQNYITRKETLEAIIWFQILGFWLLWLTSNIPKLRDKVKVQIKKQLSWFRLAWEQLMTERIQLIIPIRNYQFQKLGGSTKNV